MSKVLFDKKILKERGLVTNGFCLPYNPQLILRAYELRKKMTPAERKLWSNSRYPRVELTFFTVEEVGKPAPEKPDKLIYILTTDENNPTAREVKVGDSIKKMIEKYGTEKPINGYYSYGVDPEGFEYMDFKTKDDKIFAIQYRCEPD